MKSRRVPMKLLLGMMFMFGSTPVFFAPMVSAYTESTVQRDTTTTQINAPAAAETKTSETKTVVNRHESHGIIGSVFHVIGHVIAFPFKLIATTFEAIF